MSVVVKRDGTEQPFNRPKVFRAVYNCLHEGVGETAPTSGAVAEEITTRVVNILEYQNLDKIPIEHIQDLVCQQLWAAGQPVAATAYTLYREEHRKQREAAQLDPNYQGLVDRNRLYFESPEQELQFYDKYSRWDWDTMRRETWEESVTRVITFLKKETVGDLLSAEEWQELHNAILHREVMPSMRVLQMAGPALERCNSGGFNCSYLPLDSIDSLVEDLYLSMQGTGVGFSVEEEYVAEFPRIKKQKGGPRPVIQVADSTEGWCEAYKQHLQYLWNGEDPEADVSQVRRAGAILKTKGGRASGPQPLLDLFQVSRSIVISKQMKYLDTLEVQKLGCMQGKIVHMGGVRRAAKISLSDLSDNALQTAKNGAFWDDPNRSMLSMSNNSAVYLEKPGAVDFMAEWLNLAKSGTGERGIFNRGDSYRQIPKRRAGYGMKPSRAPHTLWFGTNPCGEVILRPFGLCNLSICVARPTDNYEDLQRKIRLATRLGTLQSMLTRFNYLRDIWRKNAEEERLLGVDLMGALECPIISPRNEERRIVLTHLRDYAVHCNQVDAARFGINPSVAVTVNKPGGNSGELLGVSSSGKPRWSRYCIRRYRIGANTPVAQLLIQEGVPHFPENDDDPVNPRVWVFEIPQEAPETAVLKDDMTAIDQLENWLDLKLGWTEHNPSTTIYVKDSEWIDAGHWVYKNWENVGGLSFMPSDGGLYRLAPYSEITKEEYDRRKESFPDINWAKLSLIEKEDMTTSSMEPACMAGVCTI